MSLITIGITEPMSVCGVIARPQATSKLLRRARYWNDNSGSLSVF